MEKGLSRANTLSRVSSLSCSLSRASSSMVNQGLEETVLEEMDGKSKSMELFDPRGLKSLSRVFQRKRRRRINFAHKLFLLFI